MPVLYLAVTALVAFLLGMIVHVLIARRTGHTESWTPEHIAYNLLVAIAKQEGKPLYGLRADIPDRKWLLDTYAECMQAVREPSHRLDAKK